MKNIEKISLFFTLCRFLPEWFTLGCHVSFLSTVSSWNHKLHIVGKLQGLRPCNFQWNSWKLGTSISFLLWENCRGTIGNRDIHNFRYWNSWISRERKGTDQNAQLGTIRSVQLGTSRIFHHDQNEGQPLLP